MFDYEPSQEELDDAIIEDTVHCSLCGSSWVLGGRADGITLNSPSGGGQIAQLKLCLDCATFVARTLEAELAEKDVCEHGVASGDWCQPCNEAYKRARIENGFA